MNPATVKELDDTGVSAWPRLKEIEFVTDNGTTAMATALLRHVNTESAANRHSALVLFGITAAICATTYYASVLGITDTKVVALWPAAGLSLWACWRCGWLGAVASFAGFWLCGALLNEGFNNFVSSAGNAVAAYLAACWLWRSYDPDAPDQLRNTALIICHAGLTLSIVSAIIGGTTLGLMFGLQGYDVYILVLRWILSDVAGVVILAPLCFAWSVHRQQSWRDWCSLEVALALAVAGVQVAMQNITIPGLSPSAVIVLLNMPLIAWFVLRPVRVRVLAGLAIIGCATLTLAAQALNDNNAALLETQLFTLAYLVSAIFLHELLAQLKRSNASLADYSNSLESRVASRTQELTAAKKRAEMADRAKSEFLANTSHEVRTPLNAILGLAELLTESNLPDPQKAQAHAILSSGRNLMQLLNDIIDLSKVEAGRLEIVRHPARLSDLAKDLDALWHPVARDKRLTFEITLSPGLHDAVSIDALRLKQCLSNLIANAIKFTPAGRVDVTIQGEGLGDERLGTLVCSVTDTGIGMDDTGLSKLFRPFEQLDASISREFGGTGLGLAITSKLVDLMGGTIEVTSSPGRGSTFTFTVQAEALSASQIAVARELNAGEIADPAAFAGLRVLLVEDNPVNRMVARGHLKAYEMAIDEAEHGAEALRLLEREPYDLVLLDIHMPVMDGLETIERIRAATGGWQNIPVIALTADAMSDDRQRLLDRGMDGYATKPIERRALLREIVRVTAGHRSAH